MIINTIPTTQCQPQTIVIGRRGTYDTMQIAFDLSYLVESYGNGVAVLAVKRSQDESAYPAIVTQEDNTLTWTISDTDTYYVGSGECQLMWYVDGGLAKTIIYPMVVMRDILQTAEQPPDGYENWIEHLTELGAETQQNAQNAAQSASDAETAKDDAVTAKEGAEAAQQAAETAVTHYPKIENNYWMVWDSTSQSYVSTGIQAEGEDGYSPEVTITSITGGHRVIITDKDHPQGQSFDVLDGQGGGGTSDYTDLTNKPQINGHTLTGNKTAADLGLATPSDIPTNAGDIEFDDQETYAAGSVGAELSSQSNAIDAKQDAPSTAGTAGQVLGLDDQLQPVWVDQTGGGDVSACAPVIINTASGDIASFTDGADNRQIKKVVGTIVPVQSGTGDPSPDNVRPISGWTGAEIEQTGKNLYRGTNATDYTVIYGGKNNATSPVNEDYTLKAGTYRISFEIEGLTSNPSLFFSSKVGGVWSGPTNRGQVTTFTFTVPENCEHFEIWAYGGTYTGFKNVQIELGSAAATDYEPYTGNQISVTFPSEAGAVYGGTLTLNPDGTGTLGITDVCVNTRDLVYAGFIAGTKSVCIRFVLNEISIAASPSTYRGAKSNMLVESPAYFGSPRVNECDTCAFAINPSGDRVALYDTDLSLTEETMRAKYADCMFVYPLATPQTIQLTAEQISGILTTLYGTNNIWSSTGDTEVTYPADTKLYIDNAITQAIANALNS